MQAYAATMEALFRPYGGLISGDHSGLAVSCLQTGRLHGYCVLLITGVAFALGSSYVLLIQNCAVNTDADDT